MVTGIVLKAVPIGEYDRRVVILTTSKGKVTAFARGARRPNSAFVAGTNPFCFGDFFLYEGRNSYTLADVNIKNYFEELRLDYEGAYYGMYFLEIADYYTRENNDEKDMLKLLYLSLRALNNEKLSKKLVRAVFEMKSVMVNGEFPGIRDNEKYQNATKYAVNYIMNSSIEKLYTFNVSDEVLLQLCDIAKDTTRLTMDYPFKSLEILDTLIGN